MATLLALFEQPEAGFSFYDVGANTCLYSLLCAALFGAQVVHAFEPNPSTAAIARRIVRANDANVEVFECALGDQDESAVLHLADASDSSNSLVQGFQMSSSSVSVSVRRLDQHVAETKVVPSVVKIDVETGEAAVLSGASRLIGERRPYLVVEVLNRGGGDHGIEITEIMKSHGYTYYRLNESPSWEPETFVSGTLSGPHRDWLLSPEPLPDSFTQIHLRWIESLAGCGPERNSRVPIIQTARAAFKRGGLAEVTQATQRYRAARRRQGDQPST